ncbi:hypothetical protein CHS0354_022059 [Potamilus streckersoni]|uniref:Nas2 N-terminal domain-containing protein n=1 Tax=Potamilus streckersoni TaxID=2493646 RepID=A0AAE0SSG1_9BIVA|nr:hypothetical protein CHS0354_022059 [Potamilus streckersoni]
MAATMAKMNQLMKRRDEIEAEIKELGDVLESQGGVGMKGPLVDAEGYPRADIDVYSVRHARHRIICLQNDHKALMKEIEEELYKIHAEARIEKEKAGNQSPIPMEIEDTPREPFAIVDRVDEGSPAFSAQSLALKVLRDGISVSLTLKPQPWSGRGLLGCNIVPLTR